MNRGKPEKYIGLAEDIRRMIQEEKLKTGSVLPSERKLSARFGVNHLTLRKALRLLEQEKLIYKVPSRGNYVGSRPYSGKGKNLVGFLFPDHEIFFYNILTELSERLNGADLHPIVQLTGGNRRKEEEFLHFCVEQEVAALIAVPNSECQSLYRQLPFPVIFFDIFLPGLSIPYVVSDDYSGSAKATQHLLNQGHRRIAHIGSMHERTSELRARGYLDTMRRAGIEPPPEYLKRREPTRQWGFYAAQELFVLAEPPSAVTCGNDTIAAGVIRALAPLGIRVPEDCAVTGFGNTAVAEDLELTSVSQQTSQIALAVWNLLRMQMAGRRTPPEITINTTLQVRGSTSPGPQSGARHRNN
jgi:DNA-binding LacI/PurR family transcriptional regulator